VGANLKRLIVTADDFGLADAVNEAVEMAHRNGIVTAASLMVGAPGADAALAIARRRPSFRVGRVLLEAKSVLSRADTPLLVDETESAWLSRWRSSR
jgi:chitin disaccharide deacetylase